MREQREFTPAKVKYIGKNSDQFTFGNIYDAYFLEYWQGVRNSLHVKNNAGEITDFNPFEEFEIISDPDNLLNDYEAYIECITHKYDNHLFDLTFGKVYRAIGMDKDGFYLVMDDSYDCYFYDSENFKIIEDKHGILTKESVYYSYFESI